MTRYSQQYISKHNMTINQYMTELTFPFKPTTKKVSCYNTKHWMLNEVWVCIIMDPSTDIRKLYPVGV